MINREAWLGGLAALLRPWFEVIEHPLPESIRVSCGFPSKRGLGARNRRIGECWDGSVSSSGHREIFISPVLYDPVEVAQVLVHELLHAALPDGVGHRAPFPRLARQLGLEGRPSATTAGDAFREQVAPLLGQLGPYPHTRITPSTAAPRPRNDLRARCAACGYSARVTRKWLSSIGAPICPCPEGGPMELPVDEHA